MPASLLQPTLGFCFAMILAGSAAAGTPESDVITAEQARATALRQGDAAALAALLAEDLRYTHSTGRIESKADIVGSLAAKALLYERFVTSDHKATVVTADVVVLNGRIDQCKVSEGKRSEARLLFLAVWRRDGGAWRMVSIQTAAPPKA